MKSLICAMRQSIAPLFLMSVLILSVGCQQTEETQVLTDKNGERIKSASLYYDAEEKPIVFAAGNLKKVLQNLGTTVTEKSLSALEEQPEGFYFVIAKNSKYIQTRLAFACDMNVNEMDEQEYTLRISGSNNNTQGYWAIGGDRIGAMYGGIHIAEIIAGGSVSKIKDEEKSPYIAKRGLKFNVPLDSRTPSFDDRGTSANSNRENVWDIAFWNEYFDVIARQRYNVLSVWNRHPFPSLVKVPGYEDIALNGVMDKNNEFINDWSIDRKIEFWNDVLELAHDRGIEVWFVVWNIELYATGSNPKAESSGFKGGDGSEKYGLTRNKNNKATVEYIKKSVVELFKTYPRMAGIGITAGEKMDHFTDDEKEQWLWDAYGEAVMEVKRQQPDRKIRFVHRHWLTDWDQIESRCGKLPDGFELSLKYAQARLYSSTHPSWASKKLNTIPTDISTWWNLRNDDIFIQRWGDPDYVREYILNFPHHTKPCTQSPCLTAGYVMGSDRYFWGRESMSKHPQSPRQLENEKHWYKFLLWGRLGYDPDTPADLFKCLIQYRFSVKDATPIYDSWQVASKIIPMINRFHFWPWDYMWWVEKGIGNHTMGSVAGFHDINQVILNKTQDVSGYIGIKEYLEQGGSQGIAKYLDSFGYTTPEEYMERDSAHTISSIWVADSLETFANKALAGIEGIDDGGNIEFRETLGDIRSQAYLGLFWAHRIRGAFELELFRRSYTDRHKNLAIPHLERALESYKKYANQLGKSYNKVEFAAHGIFDWDEMVSEVERDIWIALKTNWSYLFPDMHMMLSKK